MNFSHLGLISLFLFSFIVPSTLWLIVLTKALDPKLPLLDMEAVLKCTLLGWSGWFDIKVLGDLSCLKLEGLDQVSQLLH
jgi:hypothetical protein